MARGWGAPAPGAGGTAAPEAAPYDSPGFFCVPSGFSPAGQSSDVGYLAQHRLFDQVRLSPRSSVLDPDIFSHLPAWASSPEGRKVSSSLVGHLRGWHPRPPHRRAAVVSRKLAVLTPGPQAWGAGEEGWGEAMVTEGGVPPGRARSPSRCGRTRRKGPRQPGEGGRL